MLAKREQNALPREEAPWLLLAELHHRVSNELMAAISALHHARRKSSHDDALVTTLDETTLRLEGFASRHRLLQRSENPDCVRSRLEALALAASESWSAEHHVHVMVCADDVSVDPETGWTICVIASELLTNAFKHAFGSRAGIIQVVLEAADQSVSLRVSDDGIGVGAFTTTSGGLGSSLMCDLANRIGGHLHRRSGPSGTTVTLMIPTRGLTL